MNRPSADIIFQDETGESVDDKGSFDAEFSLLESTLIDLKDEHAECSTNNARCRNSSGELCTEAPLIISQPESYVGLNPNDLGRRKPVFDSPSDCELSGQCSNEIKPLNDNCLSNGNDNRPSSQSCKPINVPVYSSEINDSTSLPPFNSCNEQLNYNLMADKQRLLYGKHINSDSVVSICDSSIEICKNNQPSSPTVCINIKSKDISFSEMEIIEDGYENGTNESITNKPTTEIETSVVDRECTENQNTDTCEIETFEDCYENDVNESITNRPSTEIGTSVIDSDCSVNQNIDIQQLSSKHSAELNEIEIMIENNTSTSYHNLTNSNDDKCIMVETDSSPKSTTPFRDESEDSCTNNVQREGILQTITPSNNLKAMLNSELPVTCEIVDSSDSTPKKNKTESITFCNLENSKQGCDVDNKEMDPKKSLKNIEMEDGSSLCCSTPIISNSSVEDSNQTPKSGRPTCNDFEKDSLDVSSTKNRNNLKRKFLGLECIEEVDENASDLCGEKKTKYEEDNVDLPSSKTRNEDDISSSMSCFETPAKSILKKWQKNSFSRASGVSYYIIDECGESDNEEGQKNADINKKSSQDIAENSTTLADDFEIACNSLNEELMKGSSNIEALEKYYSQVQLENQMDDEMFDEVLQEIESNIDFWDKTSLLSKEETAAFKADATSTVKTFEVCETAKTDVAEDKQLKICSGNENNSDVGAIENVSSNKVTNLLSDSVDIKCEREHSNLKLTDSIKDSTTKILEESKSVLVEVLNSTAQHDVVQSSSADKKDGEDKMIGMDEEDALLEEDLNSKVKPYEFREFVSADPKENEDNYNPEWKKLGQLTSDEERYKAVRDRWRSLHPPDPNRDLTIRQWREKNHKPPLNLSTRNNNHQMFSSNERNQLCTAVFDMKIKKFVAELDECRLGILRRRNNDFTDLAIEQDKQQIDIAMRGGSRFDMSILREQHIEECRKLKHHHDVELEKITRMTNEKIRILKEAKEEVLLFQKFYKGFNTREDDEVCLYMTDIQVQELVETEEMLEQYAKFYN